MNEEMLKKAKECYAVEWGIYYALMSIAFSLVTIAKNVSANSHTD